VQFATHATSAVNDYMQKNHQFPRDIQEAEFNEAFPASVQSILIDDHTGELSVALSANSSRLNGKSFRFIPTHNSDGSLTWACSSGEVPAKYMPASCRN
jgi:hypothetical protein